MDFRNSTINATRKCSLCGSFYKDNDGHDYSVCVMRIEGTVQGAKAILKNAKAHLVRAKDFADRQVHGEELNAFKLGGK